MKVTAETVATREVELTIEPDPGSVQRALRRAAREISRWRPVPGFRPGRAPYALVERMVGHDLILNQAINQIGPELYRQAVEEADIEPYEQGRLEVESEDPVVLKVSVPLVPVANLGDYRSLHIEPEPEVSITEKQIDEQVEIVRRRHAEYEPVERPLELGDQIVASVTGTSGDETVIDEEDATLDIHERMEPPGFAEALVGMSAGEAREFSLTYPDDFDDENLAGKQVGFQVMVTAIRQAHLPEIDDDLAKMAGDYETVAEMREGLAANWKRHLELQARDREVTAVIGALVEQATVEYPSVSLEREVDGIIEERKARLQQMGFEYESYLRMMSLTEEGLREQLRPEAERRLVRRLVLTEFARAENLRVDESELADEVARATSTYDGPAEEADQQLRDGRVMLSMYAGVLGRKTIEHLTAMLTGREEEQAQESQEDAEPEEARGPESGPAEGGAVQDDTDEAAGDCAEEDDAGA